MITLKSVKPKEPDQESLQAKPKNFEDVITSSIGEIGKSQVIIMLACKFPFFVGAWSMIMMSFAGTDPDWWLETKTIFTNGEIVYYFYPVILVQYLLSIIRSSIGVQFCAYK